MRIFSTLLSVLAASCTALSHPQLNAAVARATNTTVTPRSIVEAFFIAEREFVAAPPEERDPSDLAKVISPDCDIAQPSSFPFVGQYKGVEGFLQFLALAGEWFDQLFVSDFEFFEREDSNTLVILGTMNVGSKATGQLHSFPVAQTYTVDLETAFITRIRAYHWDAYALNKAVGYAPGC